MTLIKEHEGRRILSNYNPDVLEKEIFRLTDELKRVQKENNRLEVRIDSFCARYGYDVEELNG